MNISNFDIIETISLRNDYISCYNSISELDLWNYIKKHKIKSFLLHPEPIFRQLYKLSSKYTLYHDNVYESIMRQMKIISEIGLENWKIQYIKIHRPDLYVAAKFIANRIYDILSNPNYKWGRKRIKKLFQTITYKI